MPVGGNHSIGIIGFAANEVAMLEIFFKSNKAKGFNLVKPELSDSLLVGFSDNDAREQVEKWLQNDRRPFVAVVDAATSRNVANTGIKISRPLTLIALQEALVQLSARLAAGPVEEGERVVSEVVSAPGNARDAVFAEWEARKQRSSEALSAWKGDSAQREGEALRSRFSLERSELNSLILEAQTELQKQQAKRPVRVEPQPKPAAVVEDEAPPPKLSVEMIQQCCGSLPDVNLDSVTERRRVYFSLDGLLLPWIQRCVRLGDETGKVQQVVGVPGALFYLPGEKVFLVGLDADLLLQLTRTRFGFDEISLQERSAESELPHGRKVASDELMWQLALFTARGRIPDALSAEQPRLLNEMPDFERLLETPHARSIAELWQSQRLSAQSVASMLGVPQRFVFSFFVAADAIGLYCP
ncbi:hypothetical protein CLV44_10691 [Marinobacterium halophilum]|uniref:Uncharacterized protein n=1 Tax=Marinobacterium halophilum TaxID=267374 RepID=A0A2P8EZN2_9GAMM|nr:hypothetical protein [Marinobacterium halophilum]PSL14915.1 hypothetical protein CLV44_10691 [Marinobacterium halophilum]